MRIAEELQFGHANCGKPQQSPENKGQGDTLIEEKRNLGGAGLNESLLKEIESSRVAVASNWLTCGDLSSAGLLLGREKVFVLHAGVHKVSCDRQYRYETSPFTAS